MSAAVPGSAGGAGPLGGTGQRSASGPLAAPVVCVVGSGVAGLAAVRAAVRAGARVVLVTGDEFAVGDGAAGPAGDAAARAANTVRAQGGIAAAIGPDDSVAEHLADTLAAGHGLVDAEAAEQLVTDGADAVRALLAEGFPADRDSVGDPALGLEAAHGRPRIVHAGGDRTGAVLDAHLRAAVAALVRTGRVEVRDRTRVTELIVQGGVVSGVRVEPGGPGSEHAVPTDTIAADAVVIATGGYAALYPRTSNHPGASGGGIALGARAGAVLADLEFVQFHPTALVAPDGASAFLISEAVRGAGAVLRDGAGSRFMLDAHPQAELAPRDVVSRHIDRVMRERGESCVWLDATGIERDGGAGALARRFPAIHAAVTGAGYDWTRDPIPVAPAAHYTMGGIATDLDGRTSVPGLFAAGEAAATGVHGANRLASNSLLEGLVFGARAGVAAAMTSDSWTFRGRGMYDLLAGAQTVVVPAGAAEIPTLIAAATASRTESRGAHQRDEYPNTDPAQARRAAIRPVIARAAPILRPSHLVTEGAR